LFFGLGIVLEGFAGIEEGGLFVNFLLLLNLNQPTLCPF